MHRRSSGTHSKRDVKNDRRVHPTIAIQYFTIQGHEMPCHVRAIAVKFVTRRAQWQKGGP
jgi:hypothetical protein